jgi:hypothetical protein
MGEEWAQGFGFPAPSADSKLNYSAITIYLPYIIMYQQEEKIWFGYLNSKLSYEAYGLNLNLFLFFLAC